MWPNSLTARLLLSVTVILSVFLGMTGYALDEAYRSTVLSAIEERLQNQVFTLIAVAEFDNKGGIRIPQIMPVSRYFQEDDGLYARIIHQKKGIAWESVSFRSLSLPLPEPIAETRSRFNQVTDRAGRELFVYDFGVSWDQDEKKELYTISIVESLDDYKRNIKRYRKELSALFLVIGTVLLITLGVWLRWSLSPLRRAANEIKEIEIGDKSALEGTYPTELRGLTSNINALIQSSQKRLERYRNSSADLAHSLKTPLAMMQGAAENEKDVSRLSRVCIEQIDRLNQIVSYQLQRAITTGQAPLSKPEAVDESITKIISSLNKVYADKNLDVKVDLEKDAMFFGDPSDFLEMIGNLFDNAYKWAHKLIHIATRTEKSSDGVYRFTLVVEDDGPGIDPMLAARVMERGVRSDGQGGGTGIGLAVVSDIVNAYEGTLEASSSQLGGARFVIVFTKRFSA